MTRLLKAFVTMAFLCVVHPAVGAPLSVNFEDLSLPTSNSFENGANLSGSFTSHGATFNNNYDATYDSWSGWSYSNVKDVTTAGYGNQYASYDVPDSGGGVGGTGNYGVAYDFSPGDSTIALPAGYQPSSVEITNTTYAALSMQNGDEFAKKFGGVTGNDPDFFLLTITGLGSSNQTIGTVNFYLADYRFADNSQDYIVNQWTNVDLSSLAGATSLSFGLTSSDVGDFGINTPTYFALDNLTLQPVPEPTSLLLAAFAFVGLTVMTRSAQHGRRSSGV